MATALSAPLYVGGINAHGVYGSLGYGPLLSVDLAGSVTQLGAGGFPLAVDTDAIYFASHDEHIARVALADGTTADLAPLASPGGPWAVTLDASFVYWSSQDGISRVAKTGGSVETITSSGSATVTVDDSCVYWFSDGIWTAPK